MAKKTRKTTFVKISGDLWNSDEVHEWLRELSTKRFVVVCIGGGTQINDAFEKNGFPINYGPLGRETVTFQERQLARDVLEVNQAEMQDLLAGKGIPANVIIPVLNVNSVLCHVNGDIFIMAAYHGFDETFVLTLNDRVSKKEEEFSKYTKIKVVGFTPK